MIMSSIERGFTAKKERETGNGKNSQEPSSSRPRSTLKDPRVVRVSRSSGGKDRHSKVQTMRGLRDRRIRLSVPAAIQLYDLQERLGLNQPSKVVDWLLNANQHAIDELPPLQIPTKNSAHYSRPMAVSCEVTTAPPSSTSLQVANAEHRWSNGTFHSLDLLYGKGNVKSWNDMVGIDQTTSPKCMYLNSIEPFRAKFEDIAKETMIERSVQENQEHAEVHKSAQKWAHSSLPRPTHSFFAGTENNVLPCNSYYHSEQPSTASGSHLEAHESLSQREDLYNRTTIPLPSSFGLPSGSQLLFYLSGTTTSIVPSVGPPNDFDPKQITNLQMLSSSSQNVQPNSISTRATQLRIAPSH